MRDKYSREAVLQAAQGSASLNEIVVKLHGYAAGGTRELIKRRLIEYGFDLSTLKRVGRGWNVGDDHLGGKHKIPWTDVLVLRTDGNREKSHRLRRALIESGREYVCEFCGLGPVWNGAKLVLEVDHIDGSFLNNQPDNLRFACPNCHAQTENYSRRKSHGA